MDSALRLNEYHDLEQRLLGLSGAHFSGTTYTIPPQVPRKMLYKAHDQILHQRLEDYGNHAKTRAVFGIHSNKHCTMGRRFKILEVDLRCNRCRSIIDARLCHRALILLPKQYCHAILHLRGYRISERCPEVQIYKECRSRLSTLQHLLGIHRTQTQDCDSR